MHNTQIIDLLKSFSPVELKNFGKFLSSPYFNQNTNLISLYSLLTPHYPEFNQPGISKEILFKNLFPKEKYDDKKMRYIGYDLLKLAEEYLGVINFKKDKFSYNIH